MRVFVTGGAGYIGSHTCKMLARAGHEPVIYDNLSTGHRELARYGRLIVGDIRDGAALAAALAGAGAEAVIHFAASAYVGESVRDPLAYYRNNVAGTLTLLEVMADAGVRKLVFSSSCATYGVPETLPIAEDVPQRPVNPYGETKLVCERMICDAAGAGLIDGLALRYFNAAGADLDGELGELHDPETHLIPLALAATLDGGTPLTIMGTDYPTPDGTCIRDFLHVADLAKAHLLALERLTGDAGFDAINLGTGTGYSVKQVAAAAERITGRPVAAIAAARRQGDPVELVADPAKARRVLGWSAVHSDLDTILSSAWRWMNRAGGSAGAVSSRIVAA